MAGRRDGEDWLTPGTSGMLENRLIAIVRVSEWFCLDRPRVAAALRVAAD